MWNFAFLIGFPAFVIVEILNFTGFSYERGEWLSNKELIAIAVNDAAAQSRGTFNYQSGDELLKRNPQCCSVNRGRQVMWRLIGWYVVRVQVDYQINDAGDSKYYHEYYWMNASGDILDTEGTGTAVLTISR
jgi:hypothetical protein